MATDSSNKSLEKSHRYHTRNKNKLNLPRIKNKQYRNSFLYKANKQIMLLPKIESSKVSYHTFIKTTKINITGRNDLARHELTICGRNILVMVKKTVDKRPAVCAIITTSELPWNTHSHMQNGGLQ